MKFRSSYNLIFCALVVFIIVTLINVADAGKSQIRMKKGAPHVKLTHGLVTGGVKTSRDGRPFYAFLGLRYANPARRFEPPEILTQTWKSVLPVYTYGDRCIQPSVFNPGETTGEEDCLFLNIFIPIKAVEKEDIPVMVWIHGGGFQSGDGEQYGPEYFMDEDVIIVTLNYRLGALGFLSTEDEIVPGNNGLRDQIVALQWIQKNIDIFGGDPNRVTIFGESAGSASVSHLVLSPLAKGLFQNAICLSGVALNSWTTKINPLDTANELGKLLECPTSTTSELVNCLKLKDAAEIIQTSAKLVKWNKEPTIIFPPTVEKTNKIPPVISETPENTIESGNYNKVPLILGVNEHEGIIIHATGVLASEQLTKELNEDWDKYAPITFAYEDLFHTKELPEISKKIRTFYFGDKSVSEETRENLTNLYSDIYFVHGTQKKALLLSKNSPVYLYLYTYSGLPSITTLFGLKDYGVTHADDLAMYFKVSMFGPEIGKDHKCYEFSKKLVKLWASFATERKPSNTWSDVDTWKPVKGQKSAVWYRIDEKMTLLKDPFKKRMQFWDELFGEYLLGKQNKDEL